MPADALTGPYAQQQKMLLYVLPVVFAVGGVAFPIGVLFYWTTSNLWTMGQQFYVIRNNPAPGTPAFAAKQKRDAAKGMTSGQEPERRRASVAVEEPPEPPKPAAPAAAEEADPPAAQEGQPRATTVRPACPWQHPEPGRHRMSDQIQTDDHTDVDDRGAGAEQPQAPVAEEQAGRARGRARRGRRARTTPGRHGDDETRARPAAAAATGSACWSTRATWPRTTSRSCSTSPTSTATSTWTWRATARRSPSWAPT